MMATTVATSIQDTRNSRQAELDALRQRQVAKRHNFEDSAVESASLMDWEAKLRSSNKASRQYKNQSVKMLTEYKGDIAQLDVAAMGLKATTQPSRREDKVVESDETREEEEQASVYEEVKSQPICSPSDWEARLRSIQNSDRQYKNKSFKMQQEYKANIDQLDVVTKGIDVTKISQPKRNKCIFETRGEEACGFEGAKTVHDRREDDFVVFSQNKNFFEKQSLPKRVQPKGVQSKAVQSRAFQSRAAQSKGLQPIDFQAKGFQPKVVQPKDVQPKGETMGNNSGWEPPERNTIVMSHHKLSDFRDNLETKPTLVSSNQSLRSKKSPQGSNALEDEYSTSDSTETDALPQQESKSERKSSRLNIFARRKKTNDNQRKKLPNIKGSRRPTSSD